MSLRQAEHFMLNIVAIGYFCCGLLGVYFPRSIKAEGFLQ